MEENRILDVKQVGEYLGLGRDTTRALFRQEDFPSIRLGKKYIVEEKALIEWLHYHRGTSVAI